MSIMNRHVCKNTDCSAICCQYFNRLGGDVFEAFLGRRAMLFSWPSMLTVNCVCLCRQKCCETSVLRRICIGLALRYSTTAWFGAFSNNLQLYVISIACKGMKV